MVDRITNQNYINTCPVIAGSHQFVFIIAALVLNPVAPLRFKRDTWAIVDAAAAVLLLVSIAVIDIRRPRP